MTNEADIDITAPPSGPGCVECTATGSWWFHLRRCAKCGHVGCCDASIGQHATAHHRSTGHPIVQSYEPGEEWFWNYSNDTLYESGPALAPPASHPRTQPAPGPAGRVPQDWPRQLRG